MEEFKIQVKFIAIERGSSLQHDKLQKQRELQRQLEYLSSAQNAGHDLLAENVKKVRHELEVIDAERYKAAVIRARSERLWMGEIPNKRAMSDEKRHASRNEIQQIRLQNEVTSDASSIEKAFVEHYRELFGNVTPSGLAFESEFMSEMQGWMTTLEKS